MLEQLLWSEFVWSGQLSGGDTKAPFTSLKERYFAHIRCLTWSLHVKFLIVIRTGCGYLMDCYVHWVI